MVVLWFIGLTIRRLATSMCRVGHLKEGGEGAALALVGHETNRSSSVDLGSASDQLSDPNRPIPISSPTPSCYL